MIPKVITNCQLKRSYQNKAEADETGAWLWLEKEIEVYSYHCTICDQWHLSGRKQL